MNNQNNIKETNMDRGSITELLAGMCHKTYIAPTPNLLTKFDRILLPVYQHAVKVSRSGLYITNATDATPSLMSNDLKDKSDFWEIQEAMLKVYLIGLVKLIEMDRNQLSKIFANMNDANFGLMLVAFEKARHHFFVFGKPSCVIFSDIEAAFAALSDAALEMIYNYTKEM